MKKWIIGLLLIILVGATGSAALAGRIYYQDMKTYEDYDKKELESQALQNIYIDSVVPVSVQVTDGPAYAEFTQTFTDIIGKPPTYDLEVQTKGNSSYIEVNQETTLEVSLGVKENTALCTLYLPQTTIDKLSIKDNRGGYYNWSAREALEFNLSQIDVKELSIHSRGGNIILDGEYEKVEIVQNYGRVEMHSQKAADVKIDGNLACKLSGIYNTIEVQGNNQAIEIDSEEPSQVWIVSSDGSIRLRGNYKKIEAEARGYGAIDIQSNTECKANIYGEYGSIKGDGAFEELLIKAENSPINVSTTVIPKRINIFGRSSDMTLMLPSNTPGINIIYKGDYFEPDQEPISDFPIKKGLTGENIREYTFGDQGAQIFIEAVEGNKLYVLDNGYISDKASSQEETKSE